MVRQHREPIHLVIFRPEYLLYTERLLLIEFCWDASILWKDMAGTTGLEPAASAVTGQRSNQLNYDPKLTTARSDFRMQIDGLNPTEI